MTCSSGLGLRTNASATSSQAWHRLKPGLGRTRSTCHPVHQECSINEHAQNGWNFPMSMCARETGIDVVSLYFMKPVAFKKFLGSMILQRNPDCFVVNNACRQHLILLDPVIATCYRTVWAPWIERIILLVLFVALYNDFSLLPNFH